MLTTNPKNAAEIAVIAASFASIIVVYFMIGAAGYGDNPDNYNMLRSWQEMAANGIYVPSRFQGNLPSELLLGTLAAIWGPIGSNALSLALSILSLVLAYFLLREISSNSIKIGLALSTVAVNPFWIKASTTSMDYIHPLPFFLGGILLLTNRLPIIAAVFLALAGGMRISYVPLAFVAFLYAMHVEPEHRNKTTILQSLFVFAFTCSLFYLPVFISSHLQLSFLNSARPTWQGFPGLIARWLYKTLYLYGLLGSLVFALLLVFNFRSRVDTADPGSSDTTRRFIRLSGAFIIFHLALFLYIPVRIEYLIPLLLALSGFFVVRNVSNVLLIALIVAEISYWFVSIDLIEVAHRYQDPCAPVIAIEAEIKPHIGHGILEPELSRRTNEMLCLQKYLLQPPLHIQDPLPIPARH